MPEQKFPLEVDTLTVKVLHEEQKITLIDCREPSEFDVAQISGAVLLPMSQWETAENELSRLAGKRLVVFCHHGIRSLHVTQWLRQNGFPDAQSMSGGIAAWSTHVDSEVPNY